MKKFIYFILGAVSVLGLAYASQTVYDTLTVTGDTVIEGSADIGEVLIVGDGNSTDSLYSMVIGESNAITDTPWASIAGGKNNIVSGAQYSSILGGISNTIENSNGGIIGGGENNSAYLGTNSFIGGGVNNHLGVGIYSAIVGGVSGEIINSYHSSIGGGLLNTINLSDHTSIGGGESNKLWFSSDHSNIGGGSTNVIGEGLYSVIPGGILNDITSADYSFAGGYDANALHDYSFVWSNTSSSFSTTKAQTFIVDAPGGVGIGTNDPRDDGITIDGSMVLVEGGSPSFRFAYSGGAIVGQYWNGSAWAQATLGDGVTDVKFILP